MNKAVLQSIIDDLKAGKTPQLSSEDFPCFSAEALAGNNHVAPDYLDVIAKSLTEADIPTFERAIRAVDEGDLAWLGFKVIYDAAEAQRNTDNEVTKKYGDQGSADGEPLVFFCNDAKEIVSSRTPSPRDTFQMKDVTRGPSMHNEQFEGLTWRSVALFDQVHVWLLGRLRRCERAFRARDPRRLQGDGRRLRPCLHLRGAFPRRRTHRASGRQFRRP